MIELLERRWCMQCNSLWRSTRHAAWDQKEIHGRASAFIIIAPQLSRPASCWVTSTKTILSVDRSPTHIELANRLKLAHSLRVVGSWQAWVVQSGYHTYKDTCYDEIWKCLWRAYFAPSMHKHHHYSRFSNNPHTNWLEVSADTWSLQRMSNSCYRSRMIEGFKFACWLRNCKI